MKMLLRYLLVCILMAISLYGYSQEETTTTEGGNQGITVNSAADRPLLLRKLKRTGHQILCAAINKYSIQYATGGTDNNIVIWDASDGSFINVLKGHSEPIFSVKFSPDSRHLASGGKDNSVRYWDLLSTKEIYVLEGHDGAVSSVEFNADGSKIVSASGDNTIKVWDLNSGHCVLTIGGFEKPVNSACFSPDGKFIVAVSGDKSLRIFGAESGEKISVTQEAHKNYARRVVYSADGTYIATVGDDGYLKVWDTKVLHMAGKDYTPIKEIKAHPGDWIQSLTFSSDNQYIITGGHNGKIKLWEWQKENPLKDGLTVFPKKKSGNIIYDIVLSYDGRTMLTAEYQYYADVWDLGFLNIKPTNTSRTVASRGNTYVDNTEYVYSETDLPIEFDPTPANGKNYVLIIAADDYKYWPKLQNAVKDAKDVKSVLQDKYGFKPEHTIELYNDQVVKSNIYSVFDSLINVMTGKDNLVIYYSGHGEYNSRFKQGFWVPIDGNPKDRSNYFSNTELLDFMGEMKSKHIFLIADACFSGALFSTKYTGAATANAIERSRWGLTSGYKEQVSDGIANQNSPFAAVLIDKLRQNFQDLPVSQLILEVMNTLKSKNVKQAAMGETLRLVGHESGEYIFKPKK